ncbi:MAG: hypothetical protein QF681_06615 [Vicinamibacterales bacterium]|jgi:hypothetical protein|nr:hypothetical protein [Vicinamibacterales bacterium]
MTTPSSLPTGQIVFDPRGDVTAATLTPAPRLATLEGARVGVLDNSKWNASKLLRQTVRLLEAEAAPGAINRYTKDSFSRVARAELLDRIAAANDVVITAIGD